MGSRQGKKESLDSINNSSRMLVKDASSVLENHSPVKTKVLKK